MTTVKLSSWWCAHRPEAAKGWSADQRSPRWCPLMLCCPNCSAALDDQALACAGCSADFSAGSGWRPTARPRPRPLPSFASVHEPPALRNAVQSALLFPLLGPPLGAVLVVLTLDLYRGLVAWTALFAVLLSWTIGLVPASVGGLIYGVASALLVRGLRLRRLSFPVAATLGGAAGAVGYLLANPARRFGGGTLLSVSPTLELVIVSCLAGSLVALIAAWLFPIGTTTD